MNLSDRETRIFKPQNNSFSEYLWSIAPLLFGITGFFYQNSTILTIVNILMCALGLFLIFSTWRVLNTYFLVKEDEIVTVSPQFSYGIKWTDIKDIKIRYHSIGLNNRRQERIVLIIDKNNQKITFNTSVLSVSEESELLEIIHSKVKCNIKSINDSSLFN